MKQELSSGRMFPLGQRVSLRVIFSSVVCWSELALSSSKEFQWETMHAEHTREVVETGRAGE